MIRRRLAGAVLLALLASLLAPATAAPAVEARWPVADATVEPIPAGLKNLPFAGLLRIPKGYVQEEFLLSGTATPYGSAAILGGTPADLTGAPALPYVARVTVVRPVAAARSNGSAVVTWQNVTFGHDIGEWFNVGREVVKHGWTYVEASVQPASMPALKAYDPVRYAAVTLPGDAYAHDIYSQVGKAVGDGRLTAGRPMREVVALGASQSGSALNTYLDHVQPRYERVYDGFVVAVANGPDFKNDVPVLRLLSENEVDGSSRSPDAQYYRQWEVAGSAHGSWSDFQYIGAQEERDLGVNLVDPLAGDRGPFGTSDCLVNRFPMWQAHDAALAAMRLWIRKGWSPRPQPRMAVKGGAIVRDAVGNGVGGIRLPAMAVPRAAYNRTGDCVALDGRTEAFSAAQLKRLYPTRKAYLRQLRLAVKRSVKAGVLTRSDAQLVLRTRGSTR
jgi:DNA-binding transcriptional LysR family regulator